MYLMLEVPNDKMGFVLYPLRLLVVGGIMYSVEWQNSRSLKNNVVKYVQYLALLYNVFCHLNK